MGRRFRFHSVKEQHNSKNGIISLMKRFIITPNSTIKSLAYNLEVRQIHILSVQVVLLLIRLNGSINTSRKEVAHQCQFELQ